MDIPAGLERELVINDQFRMTLTLAIITPGLAIMNQCT